MIGKLIQAGDTVHVFTPAVFYDATPLQSFTKDTMIFDIIWTLSQLYMTHFDSNPGVNLIRLQQSVTAALYGELYQSSEAVWIGLDDDHRADEQTPSPNLSYLAHYEGDLAIFTEHYIQLGIATHQIIYDPIVIMLTYMFTNGFKLYPGDIRVLVNGMDILFDILSLEAIYNDGETNFDYYPLIPYRERGRLTTRL